MVTVPPTALELFAQWLAAREAGAAPEFENFVRSHSRFAAELEALHADWKDLRAAEDLSASIPPRAHASPADESALVAQLSTRESNFKRYTVHGEIARGGMGAIVRVFDEDFRRALAMKVVLPDGPKDVASGTSSMSPKLLARFLAEAQITGQLDHPGIVPVHEIGLADDGRLYFTMKLVEGRDLKHIYQLVFDGLEDWNLTRALGVLLKACEAIAYAHKKGVIHRDLKPANIMVGSFGEVFVMDWGLARVLGTDAASDLGGAAREVASAESVRTDRSDVRGLETASGLLTVDGDVLGTPAYMPPEQARGEIESLTARSDVYSLGAMLYQLLSKEVPYVPRGSKLTHRDVLARVIAGPPRALHTIDAQLPAELVAICEKAMERDPAARYPDMLALAEDLRAYLERRVVAAYETGAFAEIKKWIARNKALAGASAALALSLLIGMIVSSSLYVKASRETERADAKATEAEHRTDDVLALSAIQDLEELIARADAAWPAQAENIPVYDEWLADARLLIDGRREDIAKGLKSKPGIADHKHKLTEIEQRGTPRSPATASGTDAASASPVEWEFASSEDRWWHAQLSRLIANLEEFAHPETGLVFEGTNPVHGWGVEKRRKLAQTIEERSSSGASEKNGWADAIASIADRDKSPAYAGLTIVPQLGLVPIGQDPSSGLWEFTHVETGEFPEIGTDGALAVRDATGLVFVLIPGGTFLMGTQSGDATKPGFDRYSESQESPPHEVTLDPFFLSKYEMTQGQWLRCSGSNPSAGSRAGAGAELPLETPVQQVSWLECDAILKRLGLVIPTEAQWEYAARAGTTTPWWTGDSPESVEGAANLADRYCKEHGGPSAWAYEEWLNDGQTVTSPVGIFRPNAFGLHDVIGNAWEWCRDPYGGYANPVRPGDGERLMPDAPNRPVRGGSYSDVILNARVPTRNAYTPRDRDRSLGVRPARRLMP
jgi:formylglycine-generating enzyme required for sulfatase activity/serine/threonine protein kinase